MPNKRRTKIIKRTFLILLVIGRLSTFFFIPRVISEIRNPVVGLIKRNKNVGYGLVSNDSSKFKRKKLTIESLDGVQLYARLNYSNLSTTKGTIILLHAIRSN